MIQWTEISADVQLAELELSRDDFFLSLADPTFALSLATVMASIATGNGYPAIRWECAPRRFADTRDATFVIVNAPHLARVSPEPHTFAEHFGSGHAATFTNLRGDTDLIAPTDAQADYAHLLRFLISASDAEKVELFAHVSTAVSLSATDPLWVSTAGAGVHWLHVRLDPRPKYYAHAPFRDREA